MNVCIKLHGNHTIAVEIFQLGQIGATDTVNSNVAKHYPVILHALFSLVFIHVRGLFHDLHSLVSY